MAKTIWIRANLGKCMFSAGKMEMELVCGHYNAIGENVCEDAVYARDLASLVCFTRGIVNSSLTALVQTLDSWAPLGRLNNKLELRHGVGVLRIVNDFSRDGDIECVRSREDAEKLCLLAQKLPNCEFDLLQVAQENGFDVDRMSARSLRALKTAIISRLAHFAVKAEQLKIDPQLKTLVLAGKVSH